MITTLRLECKLDNDATKPITALKEKIADLGKEEEKFKKPKLTFMGKWYTRVWKLKIDSVSNETFENKDSFAERLSLAGKDIFGASFDCPKDSMDLERQGRGHIVRVNCHVNDKGFPFRDHNTLLFLDDIPPTVRTDAFKAGFDDVQDIWNNAKIFCKG